jgi:predicted outer membrane repeat protein
MQAITITGGATGNYGGAIYNEGDLDVLDSFLIDNSAESGGGAIHSIGNLTVMNSFFISNTTAGNGGAIEGFGGLLYLVDSLFQENQAGADAGAVWVEGTINYIGRSIFISNTAQETGGAMVSETALSMGFVTMSGNSAGQHGGGLAVRGLITLIQNTISGDPNLAPLAYNSGVPGILYHLPTHALLPDSPARNAIPNGQNNCGSGNEDQRGVPRPQGSACDIGAFEAAILALTVTVNGNGTVAGPGINCAPDCAENFYESSSLTLTATADMGFVFSGWSGDCSGTAVCALTMNSPKNVTAAFVKAPYGIFFPAVSSNGI